jgi:hypothetical protein
MSFDVHSLEGYSTIASVSGTNPNLSIVVQTGDGAKFGNPQNVVIWPAGAQPTIANSTIGRISGITSNTLTVTTAQEGSSNITVVAGMQIANVITPKVLTDIEVAGKQAAAATVATGESTTSTTYADLTTTTDTVTATIGANGLALVNLYSLLQNSQASSISYVSFAVSGANTLAAADGNALIYTTPPSGANWYNAMGATFLLTGLTAGSTTFKMKYRVNANTGTYSARQISVVPL